MPAAIAAEIFNDLIAKTLARLERLVLDQMASRYEAILRQIPGNLALTAAAADWQPPADGALLTDALLTKLARQLNESIAQLRADIVSEIGSAPLARIEIAWDVKHPLARGLLEQASQRTGQRLGDAANYVLRQTMADAYEQGLSAREAFASVQSALREAAPWQAEMLARTDFTLLANGSAHAAAQLAGMGYKTWTATLDSRTRPTHQEAHGQTVPIAGTFIIGGEEALFPGDSSLSDAEAANCRCSAIYGETLGETEGLLADALATLPSDAGGTIMRNVTTRQKRRRAARRSGKGAMSGASTVRTVAALRSNAPSWLVGCEGWDRLTQDEADTLVSLLAKAAPDDLAAIPVHHTGVTNATSWDGNAAMGRCSSASDYRSICAWVDSGGDSSQRQSYKFPHHDSPGGPANIVGVRNALARLPQASIPSGDVAGVRAHLQAHLNDFRSRQGGNAVVADARPLAFHGVAGVEGVLSSDNTLAPRVLLPDSLAWPEMPRSFMAQTVTAEAHDGAEVAGRIDTFARRRGKGRMRDITMSGELTTPFGIDEIAPMIADETMKYVSMDLGATEWSLVERDTFALVDDSEFDLAKANAGAYALGLTKGDIMAVTLVPTQAIPGATVALTASADGTEATLTFPVEFEFADEAALVASAAPERPPQAWFETQEPPGKMPLTISGDGRVFGHIATWDSCHTGFLPSCIPPPRSASNYARFHIGELDTDAGVVNVGVLMFSEIGGHADRRVSTSAARSHYDKTGMVAAFLRVVDGKYGIWAAGVLNPDLSEEQADRMRRKLRLHPPSGDWRPMEGGYELICAFSVPVPGFPVPRAEATVTITASADGVEMSEAIIASSGVFEADPVALAALAAEGLVSDDAEAERRMQTLAARAEGGLEALAAMVE